MNLVPPSDLDTSDARDIPILTDVVDRNHRAAPAFDAKAAHAAITSDTLQLAESLLHQAIKDIEAILFEEVLDKLRAQLPELIDRALHENSANATEHG